MAPPAAPCGKTAGGWDVGGAGPSVDLADAHLAVAGRVLKPLGPLDRLVAVTRLEEAPAAHELLRLCERAVGDGELAVGAGEDHARRAGRDAAVEHEHAGFGGLFADLAHLRHLLGGELRDRCGLVAEL